MELNIAYSSSDAYAKCTGISMLSLLANNQDIEKLNLYVFTTDMTDQSKDALRKIAKEYGRKLTIIDINQQMALLAKQFKLEMLRGGYNTYVRLFCSVWLDNLERVLFIDSDTLVVGSVAEFYTVDMGDKLVAAVPDAGIYLRKTNVEDREIIDRCDKYINAGIMLINLKQWRAEDINQLIADKIKEYDKEWLNQEQTIFNYALPDRFRYVHLKYNYYTVFHFENYESVDKYIELDRVLRREEWIEAKNAPVIIHFIGLAYIRPWYEKNISPFRDIYLKYYRKSPWRDVPLEKFPKNPQLGYRIYDFLLFFTQKHGCMLLHNFIRTLFGEKLKKYLRMLVGVRK